MWTVPPGNIIHSDSSSVIMSAAGVLLALLSRGLLFLALLQLVFLAPRSVSAAPFWTMGWEDITLNDGECGFVYVCDH